MSICMICGGDLPRAGCSKLEREMFFTTMTCCCRWPIISTNTLQSVSTFQSEREVSNEVSRFSFETHLENNVILGPVRRAVTI